MNATLTAVQAGFKADEKSYWKMRPQLLIKYPKKWVAIHKGRVVAVGDDLVSIVDEALREDGYAYTNKVGEEEKIVVRKRRRKFNYDLNYEQNPMPRISAKFSNLILNESQAWTDIIPDTGSDLSSLPAEDCKKLDLLRFPCFRGKSHSYGGETRPAIFYGAKVEIGAQAYTAIIEPTSESERLLGREVLNQCKVTFDGPKKQTIFH